MYLKVNDKLYPATFYGKMRDVEWDDRESKTIRLEMTYEVAIDLFHVDGVSWSIVDEWVDEETGETVQQEYDNSDFSIAGDITDHRDGTMSVKMGKPTDLEEAYELLYGGL